MDETINNTPPAAFCTQTHWFCSLFWHFAGITALVELPKNSVAAAMDKEIGTKQILMTRLLVGHENSIFFLPYSDLQADSFCWFLSVNGCDPLSVRPPGPDSSAYQRQWSVSEESLNHCWKGCSQLLRYLEIVCHQFGSCTHTVFLRRALRQRLPCRRVDPVGRCRLEHTGLWAYSVGGVTSLCAGWNTIGRSQTQWDVHSASEHQWKGEEGGMCDLLLARVLFCPH